jgi:hypothetical protein
MGQITIKIATSVATGFDAVNSITMSPYASMQSAMNSIGNIPDAAPGVAAWPVPVTNSGAASNGISIRDAVNNVIPFSPDYARLTTSYLIHVWRGGNYLGVLSKDAIPGIANRTISAPAEAVRHTFFDGVSPFTTIIPTANRVLRSEGLTWDGGVAFSSAWEKESFANVAPFTSLSPGCVYNSFTVIDPATLTTAGYDLVVVEGRMSLVLGVTFDQRYLDNPASAATDAYICVSALDRAGIFAAVGTEVASHGTTTGRPPGVGANGTNAVVPLTALKTNPLFTAFSSVAAAGNQGGYLVDATLAYPSSFSSRIGVGLSPNAVTTLAEPSINNSSAFTGFAY